MRVFYIIGIVINLIVCIMCIVLFFRRRDMNELVIAIYAASAASFCFTLLKYTE